MKFDFVEEAGVRVFGEKRFRGKCPVETQEQIAFFNWIRREHAEPWGRIAIHPRNEQQLRGGQHYALMRHKAEGMTKGASDIVVPGKPSFVCEMKRRDHTKSKFEDDQVQYLVCAVQAGAFACVALGYLAAKEAFEAWLSEA